MSDTFPYGTNQLSVTIEVITPADGVDLVADLVLASTVPRKNQQPLLASLNAAADSLRRGQTKPALNQLAAFQNKVQAQVFPLDPALGQNLLVAIQAVLHMFKSP